MCESEKIDCPNCMYDASHAFHLGFEEGLCLGCVTHKEKDLLDWEQRKDRLIEIIRPYHSNRRKYDCIIPVTGDAEDFYVVSTVLELGLSPLIVSVNDYFKNEIGWKNYHTLITHFDVDSVTFNPNITEYKELIKTSFRKTDHIHLPWLYLHTAFPVHAAIENNIRLIIWGQCQPIEQAGKFSHLDEIEMSKWSRLEHDTLGWELEDLIGTGAQLNKNNLKYYAYPQLSKITSKKVRGIYLSNFLRWDPLSQNKSTLQFGFTPEKNASTYDVFERAGSSTYYTIHDLLKRQRLGYRKINDHLARDLRHGHITKDEAQHILKFYSQKKVYVKDFFDWLGVSKSGYEWLIQHKLKNVRHLISDEDYEEDFLVPDYLKSIRQSMSLSTEKFISIGKGI